MLLVVTLLHHPYRQAGNETIEDCPRLLGRKEKLGTPEHLPPQGGDRKRFSLGKQVFGSTIIVTVMFISIDPFRWRCQRPFFLVNGRQGGFPFVSAAVAVGLGESAEKFFREELGLVARIDQKALLQENREDQQGKLVQYRRDKNRRFVFDLVAR